jgi:hypothetical protein
MKLTKEQGIGAHSLACSTFGVEGRAGLGDGIRKSDKHKLFTQTCTKPNIRWLVHRWSTFDAKINHMQTQIHKTQHDPNLGEATTFPFIIYFVPLHEAHIQMALPKLGLPRLWSPITLCADL